MGVPFKPALFRGDKWKRVLVPPPHTPSFCTPLVVAAPAVHEARDTRTVVEGVRIRIAAAMAVMLEVVAVGTCSTAGPSRGPCTSQVL